MYGNMALNHAFCFTHAIYILFVDVKAEIYRSLHSKL
jgi:hypothetical protein